MQLCIVHVKATQRHHYIEVTDRRFNPRLITITQGDRVWWLWDRFKVGCAVNYPKQGILFYYTSYIFMTESRVLIGPLITITCQVLILLITKRTCEYSRKR